MFLSLTIIELIDLWPTVILDEKLYLWFYGQLSTSFYFYKTSPIWRALNIFLTKHYLPNINRHETLTDALYTIDHGLIYYIIIQLLTSLQTEYGWRDGRRWRRRCRGNYPGHRERGVLLLYAVVPDARDCRGLVLNPGGGAGRVICDTGREDCAQPGWSKVWSYGQSLY